MFLARNRFFPVLRVLFRRQFCIAKPLTKQDAIIDLVKMKKLPEVLTLIGADRLYQEKVVDYQITNGDFRGALKMIDLFGLKLTNHPILLEKMQRSFLSLLMMKENWMRVEEKLWNHKNVLGYYVEELFKQGQDDVAMSLVQRHRLISNGYIQNDEVIAKVSECLSKRKDLKYKENLMIVMDNFCPTEELLYLADKDTYWSMKEFGLEFNKNVFWIDDCLGENFQRASRDLFEADIIGMDSEYILTMNEFGKQRTAILQLATQDVVYIFDVEKIGQTQAYGDMITALFADKGILKVGHTLLNDISVMRLDSLFTRDLEINNYIDVAQQYKKLFPHTEKSGLAYICKTLLDKPLSKYEQVSNWSMRPLRKAQIHYATLDAYILLKIHEKLENLEVRGEDIQKIYQENIISALQKTEDLEKNTNNIHHTEENFEFCANESCKHFYSDPKNISFIVDNLPKKVTKYLRNMGFDTVDYEGKTYERLHGIAKKEKRVILTRKKSYINKKTDVPCFLFLHDLPPKEQTIETIRFFKLQADEEKILSRCIKCNHGHLKPISAEEAKKRLSWILADNFEDKKFKECEKCKNIYWEGALFKSARSRIMELLQQKYLGN